jgi:recombination protein RecR
MRALPDSVQNLIDAFARLPGIGPKTASRLAFYLLKAPDESSLQLAEALEQPSPRPKLPDML